MKNAVDKHNSPSTQNKGNFWINYILNDPETKMRIGIKESEEKFKDEARCSKLNAPLTTEEKVLLSD
ncbi:hypothetical protein [Arcticibacter tournemirensis]|uniref:Uncharacterized protein n=1 Tax=Arcticibacter tournemirensis TaxID=699437 RepID=A0A4Q0M596_9SPHI|nr:hypothetical protein [Arcticibacter tournemirensis]RXF67963.1 hypothetical protein EKH83_16930 [Arcticibacter tournemirensis]